MIHIGLYLYMCLYKSTDENTQPQQAKNILDMDLGGAFIWSVEMDDFSGHCGMGRYPLLRAISSVIRPDSVAIPTLTPEAKTYTQVQEKEKMTNEELQYFPSFQQIINEVSRLDEHLPSLKQKLGITKIPGVELINVKNQPSPSNDYPESYRLHTEPPTKDLEIFDNSFPEDILVSPPKDNAKSAKVTSEMGYLEEVPVAKSVKFTSDVGYMERVPVAEYPDDDFSANVIPAPPDTLLAALQGLLSLWCVCVPACGKPSLHIVLYVALLCIRFRFNELIPC